MIRRLLFLAIVVATGWYGWKHWSTLRAGPRDEAVVHNESGRALDRFRLMVGDQAIVRDVVPAGATVTLPFAVEHDAALGLKWQFEGTDWDQAWSGGQVIAGPIRTRHEITIEPDGGVICTAQRMPAAAPR